MLSESASRGNPKRIATTRSDPRLGFARGESWPDTRPGTGMSTSSGPEPVAGPNRASVVAAEGSLSGQMGPRTSGDLSYQSSGEWPANFLRCLGDERFVRALDQDLACPVIVVRSAQRRTWDLCRGSAPRSGLGPLLATALRRVDDPRRADAAARLRRRRSAFSSIASRMIVAIDTPRSAAIRRRRRRTFSSSVREMRAMAPCHRPRHGPGRPVMGSGGDPAASRGRPVPGGPARRRRGRRRRSGGHRS